MADDPARDGRAARARRPPQRPGQAAPPSGAAHRAIPRPTDVERQDAQCVLDAMRTLRLLRNKSNHVKVELIALALAWRNPEDRTLHGLDEATCLELFAALRARRRRQRRAAHGRLQGQRSRSRTQVMTFARGDEHERPVQGFSHAEHGKWLVTTAASSAPISASPEPPEFSTVEMSKSAMDDNSRAQENRIFLSKLVLQLYGTVPVRYT
jgi:hypothetical protein